MDVSVNNFFFYYGATIFRAYFALFWYTLSGKALIIESKVANSVFLSPQSSKSETGKNDSSNNRTFCNFFTLALFCALMKSGYCFIQNLSFHLTKTKGTVKRNHSNIRGFKTSSHSFCKGKNDSIYTENFSESSCK